MTIPEENRSRDSRIRLFHPGDGDLDDGLVDGGFNVDPGLKGQRMICLETSTRKLKSGSQS